MRVLLDECLPRRLKNAFGPDHEVTTVPERGWAGTRNGALLQLASDVVDVFVTIDAGLPYQQDLGRLPLAIVLLIAPSNRLDPSCRSCLACSSSFRTSRPVRSCASAAVRRPPRANP